jgi:two-component system, LytTR family, sensor histidine kinase AlgZ
VHPILTRPERLALYLGGWAVVGILIAGVLSRQGLTFAESLVLVLPLFLAYSFVCLSAWYVCRAVPLRSSGPVRVLIACATSSVIAGGLWLGLAYAWIAVFDSMPGFSDMAGRDRQQIPILFAAAVLLFLLALAVTYLGLAFEEAREAEQRQYELQAHARNAELRALRAQLDPHFLYNCLNSIAALTSADAGGARRMCLLLAEFLRSTLHAGALSRIPLGDELALADRFLAIEQVRFGDRLQVTRHIDQSSLAARVPPLFLQPLVENAVTHGIAEVLDGGTITVDVDRRGDRLAIAIENPCDPDALTPMRHGTGMTNVRQRLHAMFGPAATMSAHAQSGRFRVDITLPFSSDD